MPDEKVTEARSEIGRVLSVVMAIVIVVTITAVIAFGQGVEQERRYKFTSAPSNEQLVDARERCKAQQALNLPTCIDEAIRNSLDDRLGQEDLKAQQGMTFWAAIMTLVAAFTAIITALGVWFVKRTLDATLKAVEDTSEATAAMVEANRLTASSQRAWIDIEPEYRIEGRPQDRIFISTSSHFSNIGRSIATKVYRMSRLRSGTGASITEDFNDLFRTMIKSGGGLTLMPGRQLSGGQTASGLSCSSFNWDESSHTNLCLISIVIYEIEGDTRKHYSRAMWHFQRSEDLYGPGQRDLSWEDIRNGDIEIDSNSYLDCT
ncbi:hypothetical protein [Pontixanthobacter sp. CEM42]|uniref:hypothetical protein n=1 Tax=Pontixanthobacter sp. CEM42 TaxID=2792077 RepID=UPI001ADF4743|nr:hypothetical protein [Pontixanthobacter sp. CEM42]